jgi:hypothetical protein
MLTLLLLKIVAHGEPCLTATDDNRFVPLNH